MQFIGRFTVSIVCMIYTALLSGWAFTKLWSWFVVTTFGLAPLSIPAAIGLAFVVSYLTHQPNPEASKDKTWAQLLYFGVGYATAKVVLAMTFGYIVKLWM